MKRAIQDFLVSTFGAITSILTAIILYLIEKGIGFSFYSLMVWFFIPVGAIGAGFVAAGGYYFGAKFFNHRPTLLILFNMVAISIGTFILVYYLDYVSLQIDGQAVHGKRSQRY